MSNIQDKLAKATHCYVGRAKCGCILGGVIDIPGFIGTADALRDFVSNGYTIERMTISEFRKHGHWCHQCGKQATLFAEAPQ